MNKKVRMSELNKAKLYLILIVMFSFTFLNLICDNSFFGYFLSLVIFPLITWITLKIVVKNKK